MIEKLFFSYKAAFLLAVDHIKNIKLCFR